MDVVYYFNKIPFKGILNFSGIMTILKHGFFHCWTFWFYKETKTTSVLAYIYIFFLSSPFSVCNKMMKHTINYMSIFTPFFLLSMIMY